MKNKTTILIVEDEPTIRLGLKDFLEFKDFSVREAVDGLEAQRIVCDEKFDLILLDLMLPKISGEQLCRQWRQEGMQTPIIMLTAKGQEQEKISGLNLGADDYITKPFSLEELLARINAVLRRLNPARKVGRAFAFGLWQVDLERLVITNHTTRHEISQREAGIIQYFAANPGRVINRQELYERVWAEPMIYNQTRTVDMHIAKLRSKIETNTGEPELIKTVRGSGYLYEPDSQS